MPTGYTAGIIDGKITTFQEFAKACVKNFGVCIHMRDEPMDKPYKSRQPSDYHKKKIQEGKASLAEIQKMSDKKLIQQHRKELTDSKAYELKRIEEITVTKARLKSMLILAKQYYPPTPEHEGIKTFMIDQLTITLNSDGNTEWNKRRLSEIDIELESIDAELIRNDMIEQKNKDMTYHLKEYKKDLKRCAEANQWAKVFFESIEK